MMPAMHQPATVHVADVAVTWIDGEPLGERDVDIGKVGYQFSFNRLFFWHQPPCRLHELAPELAGVEEKILELLREVTA